MYVIILLLITHVSDIHLYMLHIHHDVFERRYQILMQIDQLKVKHSPFM